ncbi:DUF3857 domain-containing protein [Flavobacterium sp.]|uniref:DUF3857 domain-containing protein n=1 Tax=Flavobacterium sp. TaxID=239 RepID=UPI003D2B5498
MIEIIKKYSILSLLIFINSTILAQSKNSFNISKDLLQNANTVVNLQRIEINIISQNEYKVKTKKNITVLNEYGLKSIDAFEYYSDSDKIIYINAVIYNVNGTEIKKIKGKDFKDQSVTDGFSIITDNRIKYLDFTPIEYPFTIEYDSEVRSSNTAFVPSWIPLNDYFESVKYSEIKINFPSSLGFKYKGINLDKYNVVKEETINNLSFRVENIAAERPEDFSPPVSETRPIIKFSLENFNLEGVAGNAKSWLEFGKVWYENLVHDSSGVSEQTLNKIKELTKNETNPLDKAKIIYQYIQSKTRYVSVQLGIGGWKPMKTIDTDRLGYGDCKALSNYTRVLLQNVGVSSFYTVIFGGKNKIDFDEDFVSKQGNHVILTIPYENKNYFLECTSQTSPFAFGGDFIDDRLALVIKPSGGEIIRTKRFSSEESYQLAEGKVSVNENGDLDSNFIVKSGGIQYSNKSFLSDFDHLKIEKYYKNLYSDLSGFELNTFNFINDKQKIEFVEQLNIKVNNFVKKAGNSFILPINIFNRNTIVPSNYKDRKTPLKIERGYMDQDVFEIELPKSYFLEFVPENIRIDSAFGVYELEISKISDSKLLYKRKLIIYNGEFTGEEYTRFRVFKEQIVKNDKSKIVITKHN